MPNGHWKSCQEIIENTELNGLFDVVIIFADVHFQKTEEISRRINISIFVNVGFIDADGNPEIRKVFITWYKSVETHLSSTNTSSMHVQVCIIEFWAECGRFYKYNGIGNVIRAKREDFDQDAEFADHYKNPTSK